MPQLGCLLEVSVTLHKNVWASYILNAMRFADLTDLCMLPQKEQKSVSVPPMKGVTICFL